MHQYLGRPAEKSGGTESVAGKDLRLLASFANYMQAEATRLHVPFLAFLLEMVELEARRISGQYPSSPPD
jgi:hypothetical protein